MHSIVQWRESFRAFRHQRRWSHEQANLWSTVSGSSFRGIFASLPALNPKKDDIRLMRLLPGHPQDPVQCTLETVSLDNDPEYEALSYSWSQGDAPEDSPHSPITVNGAAIFVLSNLSSALHHLRDPEKPRTLWIDFVCINQLDVKERNSQVQLMGSVYSKAWRVVCWVGVAEPDTAASFKLLSDLSREERHISEVFAEESQASLSSSITALVRLLSQSWFSRVWTIQEVALAKASILVCGEHSIPWSVIRAVDQYLRQHWNCCIYFFQSHEVFGPLLTAVNRASWRSFDEPGACLKLSLCDLLSIYSEYHATDTRDHIYGLIGMLDPLQRTIKVDYTLPLEAVFRRAAVEMMRQETSRIEYLIRMFCCDAESHRMSTLPTWVVDFSQLGSNGFNFRSALLYNASGTKETPGFHVIDEETVAYEGLHIDTVAIIDEWADTLAQISCVADAQSLLDHLRHIEDAVNACKDSITYLNDPPAVTSTASESYMYEEIRGNNKPAKESSDAPSQNAPYLPAGSPGAPPPPQLEGLGPIPQALPVTPLSPINNAMYRTICFGAIEDDAVTVRRLRGSDTRTMAAARQALANYAASPPDTSPNEFYAALAFGDLFPYSLAVMAVLADMRFFITQKGRMGMGPRDTRPGDSVAIFKGGPTPFLLREHGERHWRPESKMAYTYVGPVFIEGYMDGEVVEGMDEGRWRKAVGLHGGSKGAGSGKKWESIYLV